MSKEQNTRNRDEAIRRASDERWRALAVIEAAKEAFKTADAHWKEAVSADYGPTLFDQEPA